MANGARAATDLILASLVSRQLDEFGFGQKETFGQYPLAFIRASSSFDGLEQTARPLGAQTPNADYGFGLLDAGAATARARTG